jgi:hypothetical protein
MRYKPKDKRIWLIAGIAVGVIVVAGLAAWFFLMRDKGESGASQSGTSQQTQNQTPPNPADPTPVVFKSAKLNIEITHRKDWTLKEASDGTITLISPLASYAKADGSAVTGPFTLKILKGVSDSMKTTIEKAIASRDSEVIGYKEPTEGQRFYTNISYAGKDKDSFNFFIVTGNTELKAGNAFAYSLALGNDFYLLAGGFGTDKTNSLNFDSADKGAAESETVREAIKVVESLKIY